MLGLIVFLVGLFAVIRILWPDRKAAAAVPLNIAALIALALLVDAIRIPAESSAAVAPDPDNSPVLKAGLGDVTPLRAEPRRAPAELMPVVSALPRAMGQPGRKQTVGNEVLEFILNGQFLKAASVFSLAAEAGAVDETIRTRVEIQALRQISTLPVSNPVRSARAYALLVAVRPDNTEYAKAAETGVLEETTAPIFASRPMERPLKTASLAE